MFGLTTWRNLMRERDMHMRAADRLVERRDDLLARIAATSDELDRLAALHSPKIHPEPLGNYRDEIPLLCAACPASYWPCDQTDNIRHLYGLLWADDIGRIETTAIKVVTDPSPVPSVPDTQKD